MVFYYFSNYTKTVIFGSKLVEKLGSAFKMVLWKINPTWPKGGSVAWDQDDEGVATPLTVAVRGKPPCHGKEKP